MTLIGIEIIDGFTNKHRDSQKALTVWKDTAEVATWKNLQTVKRQFASAEGVGDCTVFNIKGNNYRLISIIDYSMQVIQVIYILTHPEYDRNKWKKDCNC